MMQHLHSVAWLINKRFDVVQAFFYNRRSRSPYHLQSSKISMKAASFPLKLTQQGCNIVRMSPRCEATCDGHKEDAYGPRFVKWDFRQRHFGKKKNRHFLVPVFCLLCSRTPPLVFEESDMFGGFGAIIGKEPELEEEWSKSASCASNSMHNTEF